MMTGSKSQFALFLILKKRQLEDLKIKKKKKTKNKQQQSWRHDTSIENNNSKKDIRSRYCFFAPSAVDSYFISHIHERKLKSFST